MAIRMAVIGAGRIGQIHASNAARNPGVTLAGIADAIPEAAQKLASDLAASVVTVESIFADPAIDAVLIGSSTDTHADLIQRSAKAGKHIFCEKPVDLDLKRARECEEIVKASGKACLIGFQRRFDPTFAALKARIEAGEIGDIVHFRATHNEDYLMDPAAGGGWRLKEQFASKAGALGDLASHIINLAHYLCGPITEVVGESQIVHARRPGDSGALEDVENDDQTNFLVKFKSGVLGSFEASRVATGRKMGLTYEVIGTKGSLYFDQEHLAELLYYNAADPAGRRGYRTLLIGPDHPDYGNFCIGAGHGFGYNDMITVEMKDLIEGIAADQPLWPSFRDAMHTALVVDSVLLSQKERRWVAIEELEKGLQK